jgi:hypothetical protein
MWNWNKSVVCDDAMKIASYINETLGHEIRWLTMEEHATLDMHILEFHNCIGFIDGIFIEIHKP